MAYSYGMPSKSTTQELTQKYYTPRYQPPSIEDWQKQVAGLSDWQSAGRLYSQMPSMASLGDRMAGRKPWGGDYTQIIKANPYFQEYASRLKEVNKGRGGMLHGLGRSLSDMPGVIGSYFTEYDKRKALIQAAAFLAAGYGAAGGFSAAGAGGGAAGGGAAGAGAGAAAAGGTMGGPLGALAPVAGGGGGIGFGSLAGGGLGAAGAGAAAAGGGTSMAGAMGGGGFPWAPVIQGGSQLLSGYMNKRASDKASNQQKKNIQAALAQLSPEAIRQLVQMFYTQNYAMLNPAMQSAQRGVAAGAGRTGLTGAGVTRQLQAGIPGQFANSALQAASQQGLSVAGSRAGIQAGAPVNAPYSFGNDLQGIMQMLGRYGILRNNQQQTQPDQKQSQWWISGPGYDDNEYR